MCGLNLDYLKKRSGITELGAGEYFSSVALAQFSALSKNLVLDSWGEFTSANNIFKRETF